METVNQKLSGSGKNIFAQVGTEEKTLITNKKGKFSPKVCRGKAFNLYVIRSGYYVITAQEEQITISKVIGFSENNNGETKEQFAICKVLQQKKNNKWSATPPKDLERAIRKIEEQ